MADASHKADKTAAALERIERWLELLTRLQASSVLDRELSHLKLEQVYALSGEMGADEMAKKLRISRSTIVATQERWVRMGLLVEAGDGVRKSIE